MKPVLKITALAICGLCAVIVIGCLSYRDMPIKWFDEQGSQIVTVIKDEFEIPVDPMSGHEGVYNSGWAYRRKGVWNTGSAITIYGVKGGAVQDRIIDRITGIVRTNDYWDVLVTFYDDAKCRTDDNVTIRLDVPKLSQERIIGKTATWR